MGTTTYDYIVVGGGLSGCVIASRLHKSSIKPKVLLLEAGIDPTGHPNVTTPLGGYALLGSELDYAYQSVPQPNTAGRTLTVNAGKTLGGGSVTNFGGWLRGDAADYDQWAKTVGDNRWSFDGLLPWMRKTECFFDTKADPDKHGFDGPMHVTPIQASDPDRKYPLRESVLAAWKEFNVAITSYSGPKAGLYEFHENWHHGLRQPSHLAYSLEGIDVLTSAAVHRIEFSNGIASGVLLVDGRRFTVRKEVILSAGAIRTPQILMLSGIGPRGTLVKHNIPEVHVCDQVGQNLFDHFALIMAFKLRDPSKGLALGSPKLTDPALFKGLPCDWIVNETVPAEILEDAMDKETQTENSFAHSLLQHGRPHVEQLVCYASMGVPGVPMDGSHVAVSTMLLLPTSRGNISLASASPHDPPLIDSNYYATSTDQKVLTWASSRALRLMLLSSALRDEIEAESPPQIEGLSFEPLTPDAPDSEIDDRIRKTGVQHHHSGGTAAMGPVTDTECRVKGVKGLRIVDASVIPVPIGGHPQSTLYAMAEQAADMIIRSWGVVDEVVEQ
ncbi:MAG: hypothetical protein Q9165_006867 [Trypethelium subeluteriae]